MRLVGYSFSNGRFPLTAGHVPLDDLTVVLGPNDAGKSRLLSQMVCDLQSPEPTGDAPRAAFFCQCSDEEADFVLSNALSDLRDEEDEDDQYDEERLTAASDRRGVFHPEGGRRFWHLGVWNGRGLDECRITDYHSVREAWIEALADALPESLSDSGAWKTVLAELKGSSLLAFEPAAGSEPARPVLNVYWCVGPMGQVSRELANGLRASGLEQFCEGGPRSLLARAQGHLFLQDAPVVVAPIGRTAMPLLPVPVTVPTDFEALRDAVEQAVTSLVAHMRWGAVDRLDEEEGGIEEPPVRTPAETWLETDSEDRFATRVHEDALTATVAASQTVSALLPQFISERYHLEVVVRQIVGWTDGIVELWLVERRDGDDGDGRSIPVEHMADGHRLWVQLALLETVDLLRRQQALMELRVELWLAGKQEANELADAREPGHPDIQESQAGERELWKNYEQVLDAFRYTEGSLLDAVGWQLGGIVERLIPEWLTESQANLVEMVRPRMYFADEPERHLHPRLQRHAARWWVDTVRQRSSQAVVATHSVPFLNLGVGATLVYVRRQPAERAHVDAINPRDVGHLTTEAMEPGLDRGQLLGLVNVLLFVEGRHDQGVLEELFPAELREHGIAVVSMGGVSRAQGILDADVLLRYSTAKVAAWFDNVPEELLRRLKAEPGFADEVRGDKRTYTPETRHMAELLQTARAAGTDIEPIPHPEQDVFDLLDEDVVRELYPRFPGHRAARGAAFDAQAKSGIKFKPFYQREYAIPDTQATTERSLVAWRLRERSLPRFERSSSAASTSRSTQLELRPALPCTCWRLRTTADDAPGSLPSVVASVEGWHAGLDTGDGLGGAKRLHGISAHGLQPIIGSGGSSLKGGD